MLDESVRDAYRKNLREIMLETCKKLCYLYNAQKSQNYETNFLEIQAKNSKERTTHLIFSPDRTQNENNKTTSKPDKTVENVLRISEQEARFCMTYVIENDKRFLYSVETPTEGKYCFKKNKENATEKRRARSDLSLWSLEGEQLFNIELKAKNPESDVYEKDFEKLLCEKTEGVWFQILKAADEKTFKSLTEKINNAIKVQDKCKADIDDSVIHFVFCVMDGKYNGKKTFGTLELSGKGANDKTVYEFLNERFNEIRQ